MLKIIGKYGSLRVNNTKVDINSLEVKELENHLNDLEKRQAELIKMQNEYLSEIIEKESKDE